METKRKILICLAIAMIWIVAAIASTPSWPPEVEAKHGRRSKDDCWGDVIQITANYNIDGGHVDFKAVSGKTGIKISSYGVGYTIGTYVCRIRSYRIKLKCYDKEGNIIKRYSKTYSRKNRGAFRKSVRVPPGTVKVYAYMKVKFQLLIAKLGYPTKTLKLRLYA